ncbi:DUF6311 domain-containing protein [Candidatus Saccharibacteria bacterium]|nr:DUF6311 domain-containing protein [Candidatus Saccharibacteria bacterium]
MFLLGALVGVIFFAVQFGLATANPLATDWIWHGVTHDTAQHFIGWEFFRADSTGAVINGLAYPEGLPITFMDGIPLLALPLKLIAGILPAGFQYFGLWALACYILQGGIAAVLVRKIWRKVFKSQIISAAHSTGFRDGNLTSENQESRSRHSRYPDFQSRQVSRKSGEIADKNNLRCSIWQILFVVAGALIFVLASMMIARTLYHPALAAHWLILLGILLVWDAPKFAKWWKSVLVWSAMLVGAVLIHPYFLPMLTVIMLVAMLRLLPNSSSEAVRSYDEAKVISPVTTGGNHVPKKKLLARVAESAMRVIIPIALAGLAFWAIGGFALGSGAEIRDLHEKGFNLLSFANPGGYSIIPAFPNASSSPETLMWLGLGVWAMLIAAAILWRGRYKKSVKNLVKKFKKHRGRNIAIAVVGCALLAFAIGVRVDVGPLVVFQWEPPAKIYELWSAFRAAAREAWPFYYLTILLVIYWFAKAINCHSELVSESKKSSSKILGAAFGTNHQVQDDKKKFFRKFREVAEQNIFATVAVLFCAVSAMQFIDIWFSEKAVARREGFAIARTAEPQFRPMDIKDLLTTQKHLVMLDSSFRGDQSGTYEIARTALANNLTMNIGFFARIPDPIWEQQTTWRNKVLRGKLSVDDLRDYIFATRDEKTAKKIAKHYRVEKRENFWFIIKYEE